VLTPVVFVVVTSSHYSASIRLETFNYPRLSVGLNSVRGRKFNLSPKIKGHILGICILYDKFITVLFFPPLLRCVSLNLYSLDIFGNFW